MSRTVGDVGDELLRSPLGTPQQAVGDPDDDPYEVDVAPFVESPDVVGLAVAAPVEDRVDGPGMVLDIEPVADVFAPAVDRQRLVVTDVVDEQRDELLGKLVGPVVVRTVGDHSGKPVGVVKRPYEMVRRRLRRRIGAVGIVARGLGEESAAERQSSIHLVGRDVVEPFALPGASPDLLRGLQERERPHDIGAREGERIADRAVHVALGREVDHPVDGVFREQRAHGVVVADVASDEGVVGGVLDVAEVGEVARIGQQVEVDDPVVGVFRDEQPHDVRADESGAAGYEDGAFHACIVFRQ